MNLYGFCGADPSACGFRPPPPPPPPPGATPYSNTPYAGFAERIAAIVGGFLVETAANVGKTWVCPAMPAIGAAVGRQAAIALLPWEILTLGPISITAPVFGEAIGLAAGEEAKKRLCG